MTGELPPIPETQAGGQADPLVLENSVELVTGKHSPATPIPTPYMPPELVIAFLTHADTSSPTGRRAIALCRKVCRHWSQLLHPLAFQDAVISFTNHPAFSPFESRDYDEWCSTTRTSLEAYILPLSHTCDSKVVKRLTLKGHNTNKRSIYPIPGLLSVCVLRSLIEHLPQLEDLYLYGLAIYPCRHGVGCLHLLERPVAKSLKSLCLDGVDVFKGEKDPDVPEVPARSDPFGLIQSLNPCLLRLQGVEIALTWWSDEVEVPIQLRSLDYTGSNIVSYFERFTGLDNLRVGRLQSHEVRNLQRIIRAAANTLKTVIVDGRSWGAPFLS